jgi:hypothetical protein
MCNALIEITFFNFPELSYTLTSCIKLPRFNLFPQILIAKKATPKGVAKFKNPLQHLVALPSMSNWREYYQGTYAWAV